MMARYARTIALHLPHPSPCSIEPRLHEHAADPLLHQSLGGHSICEHARTVMTMPRENECVCTFAMLNKSFFVLSYLRNRTSAHVSPHLPSLCRSICGNLSEVQLIKLIKLKGSAVYCLPAAVYVLSSIAVSLFFLSHPTFVSTCISTDCFNARGSTVTNTCIDSSETPKSASLPVPAARSCRTGPGTFIMLPPESHAAGTCYLAVELVDTCAVLIRLRPCPG